MREAVQHGCNSLDHLLAASHRLGSFFSFQTEPLASVLLPLQGKAPGVV